MQSRYSAQQVDEPTIRLLRHEEMCFPANVRRRAIWLLQLPYVDEKLDLFVVLPENAEGKSSDPQQLLHNLEKRLTMTQLQTLEDVFKMSRKEVRLSLPRFK